MGVGGRAWRESRLSYQGALFIGSEVTISKEMVGTPEPYWDMIQFTGKREGERDAFGGSDIMRSAQMFSFKLGASSPLVPKIDNIFL